MKILMIVDHKIPTDIRIENEAELLVDNGHELGILTFDDYDKSEVVEYNGYTLFRVGISKFHRNKMHGLAGMVPWMDNFVTKQVLRIHKEFEFNAIHFHDLYLFGAVQQLKSKLNVLCIGDMHENYVEVIKDYKWPRKFPNNFLVSFKKWERKELEWLPRMDKVITVSKGIRERLIKKGVAKKDALVVANSIRLELFDSFEIDTVVHDRFKDKFVILYVGGFIANRGLEHVVESMPKLRAIIPNIQLLLVGDGEMREHLQAISKSNEVTDIVSFEGWKQQSEIKSYLTCANVGLVPFIKTPQTDNSSSNKLFQYMYYKLPIVATNCNSVEELLIKENCGIVYESESIDGFVNSILKIYSNKELALELGENGYKAVKNKYNWSIAAKPMLDMYSELENSNR